MKNKRFLKYLRYKAIEKLLSSAGPEELLEYYFKIDLMKQSQFLSNVNNDRNELLEEMKCINNNKPFIKPKPYKKDKKIEELVYFFDKAKFDILKHSTIGEKIKKIIKSYRRKKVTIKPKTGTMTSSDIVNQYNELINKPFANINPILYK